MLLPDRFDYIGPEDLTEYNVRRTVIMGDQDTPIGVKVTQPLATNPNLLREQKFNLQIVLQRRLLSLFLTTFLPTLLINTIGHMSNYFRKDFFEGQMAMNVTVMLVLTTLFIRKLLVGTDLKYFIRKLKL